MLFRKKIWAAPPISPFGITKFRGAQERMLSHMVELSPQKTQLEVESKFNVTPLLRSHLDGTYEQLHIPAATSARLLGFTRQPDTLISDQYFDLDDALTSKGIWVRRRTERTLSSQRFPLPLQGDDSAQWGAKVKVGGDYQSSQFEELVGKEAVMDLVKQHVSNVSSLRKAAYINTFREAWAVREHVERAIADQGQRMSIVIDRSTAGDAVASLSQQELEFQHVVGEVELTRDLDLGQDEERNAVAKQAATAIMKTELDSFMERHSSLFPTQPVPVGKLSAYFAWRKQTKDHLE
ncbi:hypothetical protein CLAFUW4_04726 [Fulvia fulva]|uniref:CYTH domain-containing protein n=1 Tax=Passalora fulva TaxID=5499 RepID=A0A9Q8LF91_PASFU|nr:uncharacterized protein CLAFUR5_04686 [Fulvia fulva]KAK4626658.1 hypothetical protein CLAFUR4_04712 [Fulvia fulva]KAK4628116.1 hypothetical protein CLAFUR0_04716 [Fulvia fulva]UJO16323.1 hypothetical protein CLAFUR5_04686 [Fulvia fulva]WPV14057.1 hypothetical protein CLAFUW4_04726 [Fulvia fulva]WPV28486.1 hypothetical protein CLAFUW7_04720 [Fulvia fulva]